MKRVFAIIFFFAAYAMPVSWAGGEFRGIVREDLTGDLTGDLLGGAHIALENTRLGAVSDYSGAFRIINIPAGEYSVRVTYIGYEDALFTLVIRSGETVFHDFTLVRKPYLADQAVITANRTEVSRSITPMAVTLVDREALENSGESNLLPVVARHAPGVFVTERGVTGFGVSDGAAGQISIRGIGGSPNTQVLVLVDGHPQFMGIFGHPLPDTYIASDAEAVEVVRGPASILYGSNAMGGVINVITRGLPAEGLSLQGTAGYGNYNTLKVNGHVGFRKKKFQSFVSFNRDQTDGHRPNSDFRISNGYAKLSFDINSHFKVWADASLAKTYSTNPGPVDSPDTTYQIPGHWQDIFRGFGSAALENRYLRSHGAVKFYYNWGEHQLYDGFISYDKNFGIMAYQVLELFKGNTLTVGYDFASYGGKAKNLYAETIFVDTMITENAGYALLQQELLSKLTIMAGIRYQYHELYQSEWVPHFGLSYRPGKTTTLRASAAKGFRSPSIRELFLFKPANPELMPEDMWNYETGVMQRLAGNKVTLDLAVFYSKGRNLIQVSGVPPDIRNENTGDFEHYGLEFQSKWLILENLDVMANYSWLHTDQPRLAAPKNMVYVEGNYRPGDFYFRLAGQYINQLVTQTSPEVVEESYFNLSARVSYTYLDFVTFFLDGNNLLNQDYQIMYGYPMPGITIFGGFSLKWNSGKKKAAE